VPAAQRDSQAPAWPSDVIGGPGSSSSTRHSVSPRHSRRLLESFRYAASTDRPSQRPTFAARIGTAESESIVITVGSERHASCAKLNRPRSLTRPEVVTATSPRCAYARRSAVERGGHAAAKRLPKSREQDPFRELI